VHSDSSNAEGADTQSSSANEKSTQGQASQALDLVNFGLNVCLSSFSYYHNKYLGMYLKDCKAGEGLSTILPGGLITTPTMASDSRSIVLTSKNRSASMLIGWRIYFVDFALSNYCSSAKSGNYSIGTK
jgi:hypothetical protein